MSRDAFLIWIHWVVALDRSLSCLGILDTPFCSHQFLPAFGIWEFYGNFCLELQRKYRQLLLDPHDSPSETLDFRENGLGSGALDGSKGSCCFAMLLMLVFYLATIKIYNGTRWAQKRQLWMELYLTLLSRVFVTPVIQFLRRFIGAPYIIPYTTVVGGPSCRTLGFPQHLVRYLNPPKYT